MNTESLVTAAMCEHLLSIPASRVRYWAYAGRLARTESGYYKLGDILQLQNVLAERARKGDQRVKATRLTPWPMQEHHPESQFRQTKRRTAFAASLNYNG